MVDEQKIRGVLKDLSMVVERAKELNLDKVAKFTNVPVENLEVIIEALEKQLPKKVEQDVDVYSRNPNRTEVIGNIFENPELLEVE